MQNGAEKRLGLWTLTGIVFGMVVGSGLFNLPQNMAAGAGLQAVGIAWLLTAAGMLLLVLTLKTLADRHPELDAGIYQYAQKGFGNFTGFNIAWGYWLCTAFANVAYAVMLNDSFAAFFPALGAHSWPTLAFGTVLIWTMFFIVSCGMQTAKLLNNCMAVLKIAAIALVVVLLILNIRFDTLSLNFLAGAVPVKEMASQVESTMLVTLWCFIGIEGAVMMAARAKRPKDVGRAGVMGFFTAWLLYVLVTMLCYGVMSRAELQGLDDPSVAYVLRGVCGEWAYWFVLTAIIVSLLGGWLSWTLVTAQVPYEAATVGIFPRVFLRCNRHGMPWFGLLTSSIVMETFLMLVLFADDVYLAALNISSMMVLPAYLLSGAFLFKLSWGRNRERHRWRIRLLGGACTLYCLWLLYAAGIGLLAMSSLFYLAGLGFYAKARAEGKSGRTDVRG